jgi:toxin-antitoxin system PIN domain toxin
VIAVDTALLVYAHRQDSPHHEAARAALESLAARTATWAIPWPAIHEFLAVITHPRIYVPPTPNDQALAAVRALAGADNVTFIGETPHHLEIVEGLMRESRVGGVKVQDARIAAICIGNGIKELWTADRDLSWFPQLHTHNPLTLSN